MAFRSRMKDFAGYRSARQRNPAPAESTSDQTPLVGNEPAVAETRVEIEQPPWLEEVEQAKALMETIHTKMAELKELHKRALKPSFDSDAAHDEHEIELQTKEITRTFYACQASIGKIKSKGMKTGSAQKERMANNVVQSLASQLQDESIEFKSLQSTFLKKMRVREQASLAGGTMPDDDKESAEDAFDPSFTDAQQEAIRQNSDLVREREEEITKIVNSIEELSNIFKDLATMIIDQGTILDRIDYNLEVAAYHISTGEKELVKSEKYQKKATKKMIIILLVLVVIAFIFVMIFHSKHS